LLFASTRACNTWRGTPNWRLPAPFAHLSRTKRILLQSIARRTDTGTHTYVHGAEKQRLREGRERERERERESSTIRGHLHPYPLLRRSGTRRSAYDTQVNVVRYSLSDPLVDHTYLPWTEGAGSSSNIPFSSFRFTCAVAAEVEML
jgi:hypothetical protein